MLSPVFEMPATGPGRLFIGPHPRPDDLAGSLAEWRADGMDVVLSLLDGEEARMLGLAEEAHESRAAGLRFLAHPVTDFAVPPVAELDRIVRLVLGHMAAGRTVMVHCRAGIGRSGMTACGVLIRQGLEPAMAIAQVSAARGLAVPDTPEQAALLHRYGAAVAPSD